MSVTTIEVTSTTVGWADLISRHLASGEHAYIRFDTPSMTPQQMADSIGISRQAIMRWINEGKIVSSRRGNRHRIAVDEVERFRRWYVQDIADASADDALADLFGDKQ